jgi:multiple sugar transport system permease protein
MAVDVTARVRVAVNRGRWRRDRWTPWLYVLPALIVLAAVMGFPIVRAVLMSFQRFTLTELVSGNTPFVGLDNYTRALADPTFPVALLNSIVFTVASVGLQFTIGFGLALLFSGGFPMSNAFRGLMLTGWQIPVVVTGTLFLWMFNVDYGVVNYILQSLHVISEPIGWTVDAGAALPAVIIANVWLGIPFNLIMLSAAMAGLPSDIYEAATVDGASSWQKVRHLTVPLLRPAILAVLMLGFIYTLRVFDLIWIMTKGGPGNATEVLPTFAYRLAFVHLDFGESAAVAVFILLILFAAALAYLRSAYSDER